MLWRDRRGAVAVEAAFVLPVLLAALLGLMECGRLAWTKATLLFAVEEAARCSAIGACATNAAVIARAVERAGPVAAPASAFSVTAAACGTEVRAQWTPPFVAYKLAPGAPPLRARYCRR